MTEELLELIRKIRKELFPSHLRIGHCIDVCIGIASALERDHGKKVTLIHGMINDCRHTWIEVDGFSIDVARDCIGLENVESFVEPTTFDYLGYEFDPFNYADYFT